MEKRGTIVEHLSELRRRMIICLITIFIFSILSYMEVPKILNFLTKDVEKLVFIKPAEAFFVYLKVALFTGVALSFPILAYHFWKFINPALFQAERRYLIWLIPMSTLLFIIGGIFCFTVVLPIGIKFLLSFETDNITQMLTLNSYINFVLVFLFCFGLIFQVPLVVLLLTKLGIITPKLLSKKRKYVIIGAFIIGAILTPADIFSQFLMAVPLVLLYEISILISRII